LDGGVKMNQIDKISKEAMSLLNYAKDTAIANLTTANGQKKLEPQLDGAQLLAVINLLNLSLSQGFQKGLPSFQKTVKHQIDNSSTTKATKTSELKKK
jgi:hypothetical protein